MLLSSVGCCRDSNWRMVQISIDPITTSQIVRCEPVCTFRITNAACYRFSSAAVLCMIEQNKTAFFKTGACQEIALDVCIAMIKKCQVLGNFVISTLHSQLESFGDCDQLGGDLEDGRGVQIKIKDIAFNCYV
eukprot:m.58498 g.58498  ORF g.58498 m.58498 type:complete len:133 (-) comp9413_c0_seq2:3098-3496(-)